MQTQKNIIIIAKSRASGKRNGNDNGGRLEVERQGERGGRVRKQVHNYNNLA